MPLSDKQLNELRRILLNMKQSTEESLDSFLESVQELSNYDNHPADQGTELFERSKDVALREHAVRQLDEIKQALEKMDAETYGICETCHKEIPFERLKAHPTALRCIEHSRDQTVAIQRPVEEQWIEPPFVQNVNGEENSSFDAEDTWQSVAKWGTSETPSDFFSNEKKDYNNMYFHADEKAEHISYKTNKSIE